MPTVPSKVICDVCGKEIQPTYKMGRHGPRKRTAGITADTSLWLSWQRGGREYRVSSKVAYCHPECEGKLFEILIKDLRKRLDKFPSKFEHEEVDDRLPAEADNEFSRRRHPRNRFP